MYTYKDFETGKIRRTRGQFIGFTKPTGILNARYAIFRNPRGDVLVPEYALTDETNAAITQTAGRNRPDAKNIV